MIYLVLRSDDCNSHSFTDQDQLIVLKSLCRMCPYSIFIAPFSMYIRTVTVYNYNTCTQEVVIAMWRKNLLVPNRQVGLYTPQGAEKVSECTTDRWAGQNRLVYAFRMDMCVCYTIWSIYMYSSIDMNVYQDKHWTIIRSRQYCHRLQETSVCFIQFSHWVNLTPRDHQICNSLFYTDLELIKSRYHQGLLVLRGGVHHSSINLVTEWILYPGITSFAIHSSILT